MFHSTFKPMMLALALSCGASTFTIPAQADQEEKAVRVREASPVLKLQVMTDKPAYRVDEPIRLKVRSEQAFYLYVYAVDEASGNAWLLLPNRKQPYNRISANQWQKVPGPNLEFVSDRPGTEKLIVVASAKKVDIDPAKLSSKAGDFAETKALDLEDSFEAKGIRVRDVGAPQAEGVVVKRLAVKIVGKGERAASDEAAAQAVSFVNSDKARYQEGERMHIVYGANAAGWVHLYVVEPDGTRSLLKRQQVKGNEQMSVNARAEAPYGKHQLVAVYSQDEAFDEGALDRVNESKDAVDKGIRIEGDDPHTSIAVRSVSIFRD